jgi:nucleotide-binding universal stress UspA family protein
MPCKTLLVCLNETDRADTLISVNANLARRFEAHVIGLYVIPAMQVYPAVGMYMTAEVFEGHRKYFQERAASIEARFNEAMRKQGLSSEWRRIEASSPLVADTVIEHGFEADMIVVSQTNRETEDGVELDFTERVVMETGRPVLIIPLYGKFETVANTVLVGWNGTREAARAVFDALPIMQVADKVYICWVDPKKELQDVGQLPGAEIATSLARHGIKATVEPLPTSGLMAGEALISHASDLGADLLVMGAYGHSRMREFVFGGATRYVLQSMTVPVLLSH